MSARLVLDPGCTIMNTGISRVGRDSSGKIGGLRRNRGSSSAARTGYEGDFLWLG
jgi:hypothetical protein